MRVRDVMTTSVVTARVETPFPRLVDLLVERGISGLPVVEDDGSLVGMVTEADLVSKEAYGGRRRRRVQVLLDLLAGGESTWAIKARGLTAGQLMTTEVETVRPDTDVRDAAREMVEHGHKRLPVVEGGRLVGIVSRTDLLRTLHRSDHDLERDVERMLVDPLRAPDDHTVSASVHQGVVSLAGTVRYPLDLPVLEAMVWRIPGVAGVHHAVTAREPDPTPVR